MKVIWAIVCALLLTGTAAASSDAATRSDGSVEPVVGYADAVAPHGFFWQLFAPQDVVPGAYLYALPTQQAPRKSEGTRSDQQFFEISSTGSNDVPEAALRAYKHAASVMAKTDPGCGIHWTMLAAIGRVESNHGRFGGSQLGSDGVSRPAIVGPRLDGAGPFAAISDSDGGALDGDKKWDRAIGQMQFLPSTWRSVARDGDGDGVANPGDLDDSALGSAVYLCGAGDLSTDAGMAQAAFRYNHSDYYAALVLSFVHGYRTGVFVMPSPPPPPGQDNKAAAVTQVVDKATKDKKPTAAATAATTPRPTTTSVTKPGTTTTPTSAPPTPTATPDPQPVVDDWNGPLQSTSDGLVLGGAKLLLDGKGGDPAADDWDGNGTTETVAQELAGLDGKTIKLRGSKLGDVITYISFGSVLP